MVVFCHIACTLRKVSKGFKCLYSAVRRVIISLCVLFTYFSAKSRLILYSGPHKNWWWTAMLSVCYSPILMRTVLVGRYCYQCRNIVCCVGSRKHVWWGPWSPRLRNDLYCVGWGVKLYSNQTWSPVRKGTLRGTWSWYPLDTWYIQFSCPPACSGRNSFGMNDTAFLQAVCNFCYAASDVK